MQRLSRGLGLQYAIAKSRSRNQLYDRHLGYKLYYKRLWKTWTDFGNMRSNSQHTILVIKRLSRWETFLNLPPQNNVMCGGLYSLKEPKPICKYQRSWRVSLWIARVKLSCSFALNVLVHPIFPFCLWILQAVMKQFAVLHLQKALCWWPRDMIWGWWYLLV